MSDIILSRSNRADQATQPYPALLENKKDNIAVQECLTKLQNDIADQGVQIHAYNQKMRYLHTKNLCNSFEDQSRFYVDSTFWTTLGRGAQIAFVASSVFTQDWSKLWEHVTQKLPVSETAFKAGHEIYSSFHERKNPAIKSVQLIEQKKVEHLTQSDNTETNIIDRVQQMFQNAKDLLSQLYKSFSS